MIDAQYEGSAGDLSGFSLGEAIRQANLRQFEVHTARAWVAYETGLREDHMEIAGFFDSEQPAFWPGDVVRVSNGGHSRLCRVVQYTRHPDGMVDVEVVAVEGDVAEPEDVEQRLATNEQEIRRWQTSMGEQPPLLPYGEGGDAQVVEFR